MRYDFRPGPNRSLSVAANWQPAGGPPGTGDLAVIGNLPGPTETLYGTADVGALVFTNSAGGAFVLNSVTLKASMPVGTQFLSVRATANDLSLTTTALTVKDSAVAVLSGSLQTERTNVYTSGSESAFSLENGTWANSGNVLITAGQPQQPLSSGQAWLTLHGAQGTIGGNLMATPAAGADAEVDLGGGTTLDVKGDITLSGTNVAGAGGAGLGVEDSVMTIGHDLLVNATGSGNEAVTIVYNGSVVEIGDNAVYGNGGVLSDNGAVFSVGNELALLDGASATIDGGGTVAAHTVLLEPMAFIAEGDLSGGPGTLSGVNGGQARIINQGTLAAMGTLTVDGNIVDHGTLQLGSTPDAAGNMTVNGEISTQLIRFGGPGSQLFAQDFGGGDGVQHFLPGDVIASPDIANIAFDSSTGLLTLDKQSGAIEHLVMHGDFSGQTFTLTDHEFITLQPSTS